MYNPVLNFLFTETHNNEIYVKTHQHSCYEIVYFFKTNSHKFKCNDNEFMINSGNLYVVYPETPHSEQNIVDSNVIALGFDCKNFPHHIIKETVYTFPNHKHIYNLMKNTVFEAMNHEKNYKEITSHLLSEILLLMERYISNEHSTASLDYAYNYIYEYCNQNINFTWLANLTGYSPDHFRHIFTKVHGISPKQFQINMRLEKAIDLLANSSFNCTDIANSCGFSTSAQFSKIFKEHYNVSPKQFQQLRNRN